MIETPISPDANSAEEQTSSIYEFISLFTSFKKKVKSALMVAPQLSENDQAILFQSLTSTYGKTIMVWDLFKNPEWPKGIPELFMGFTDDGQLDPRKRMGEGAFFFLLFIRCTFLLISLFFLASAIATT
jgi:hypothetical protein